MIVVGVLDLLTAILFLQVYYLEEIVRLRKELVVVFIV